MAVARKINVTKDYAMFGRNRENRPTDATKHRLLKESMKKNGFRWEFPIICIRNSFGGLVVLDGQHRLMFAETLGLPVYWVEAENEFDVAEINSTAKTWTLIDHATVWAEKGLKDYKELLEFMDIHRIAVGTSAAMLCGVVNFSSIKEQFVTGKFKIRDRAWADLVASVYVPLVLMSPSIRNTRFVEACMAVCKVEGFDVRRMLRCAERQREKLVPYSTKDAYLTMLEDIYNFGQTKLVGLKAAALMAMKGNWNKAEPKAEPKSKPKKGDGDGSTTAA